MQHEIKIQNSQINKTLKVESGQNLLRVIQEHVSDFFAPCGGNGTCGKCRVHVQNEGHVTSCLYTIDKNIEVMLPEKAEMKILSSQYELTKILPLNLGAVSELKIIPYGLAIDIGTTSIVFYIVNLMLGTTVEVVAMVNPQSKFGADVISRINYGIEQKNGVTELQSVLIQSINKVLNNYTQDKGLQLSDFVKISIVGNTVMMHQLMAIDAKPIALAPFTPVFTETKTLKAKELGIVIHDEGELLISPSLSGYVGADIIAGLASVDTEKLEANYLFIDLGTNGELVLVTPNKVLACATAAGPAFEGANISCGMGALPGAISAYSAKECKVIANAEAVGICGSGLIDVVANMLQSNHLQSDGNIEKDFVISETENYRVGLTQQDIREVQLAKSAIAAGINRMLAMAEMLPTQLDHVLIAGGFGNYMNIQNAIHIGLLPDLPIDKYITIGNSAGSGAVLALKSESFITHMEDLKQRMEYIELSNDPEFGMEYAMNMYFNTLTN